MKVKSAVTYALVGALSFAPLVGCGASQENGNDSNNEPTEEVAPQDEEDDVDERLEGGWAVNTEATPSLSDDELAIFQKAAEGYDGASFEPVSVLATQLVSGTNYAYLCQEATVTANTTNSWAVVTVYNDLEDNASITNVEGIELGDIDVADADDQSEDLVGAWQVREPSNVIALPQQANDAFAKASEGYVGVALSPVALLGTQDVSGTNYLMLCQGSAVVQDPKPALYIAQVYEDLDGNAEFTNVVQLDLLEYV